MLVLSRKIGEKLIIGDNISVTVTRVSGNRVTLGIEAPASVRVKRGELEPDAAAEPAAVVMAVFGEADVANASVPRLAK